MTKLHRSSIEFRAAAAEQPRLTKGAEQSASAKQNHVSVSRRHRSARVKMGEPFDVEGTKKKVQNELAAAALQDLFQV